MAVLSEDNLEALTEWSRPLEGKVLGAPALIQIPDGGLV